MRYINTIIFLGLFLAAKDIRSQNVIIDSLWKLQKQQPKNDTIRFHISLQTAFYFDELKDSAKALQYAQRAHDYAVDLNYSAGLADYYHFMAVFALHPQDLDRSMNFVHLELKWAKKSKDSRKLLYAFNDLGNLHLHYGNGDSAVLSLLKAKGLAEALGQKNLIVNIYYNLSAAYSMTGRILPARDYAKKAWTLARELNVSRFLFNSLYNWATMEVYLGNVDTALVMFKTTAEMAIADGDELNLMDVYNNLGEVYYKLGEYGQSLAQYNEIARIAARYDSPDHNLYLHMNRGNTLLAMERLQMAEADLVAATALAERMKANFELAQIYSFRTALAEKKGDFAGALAFMKVTDSLKALTAGEKAAGEIRKLEAQYRSAEKDRSLARQQLELTERQAVLERKETINRVLIAGCVALLIIAILAFRNVRHRSRLAKQEKEIHDREVREMQKQHRLDAMQAVLQGQEEERGRLARDLHDGVGGLLVGLKLNLYALQKSGFSSMASAKVDQVILGLDQSIEELRRVSHNLMPAVLLRYGLVPALENYCSTLASVAPFQVRLQLYGMEDRFEQNREIILYRIVQELLTNVSKHAEAQNVLIQLTRKNDGFSLTVEDDGKGFEETALNGNMGAGLANVVVRADYLGGEVDVYSQPGKGTSIHITGKCGHAQPAKQTYEATK